MKRNETPTGRVLLDLLLVLRVSTLVRPAHTCGYNGLLGCAGRLYLNTLRFMGHCMARSNVAAIPVCNTASKAAAQNYSRQSGRQ